MYQNLRSLKAFSKIRFIQFSSIKKSYNWRSKNVRSQSF